MPKMPLLQYYSSFINVDGDLGHIGGVLRTLHCRRISIASLKGSAAEQSTAPQLVLFDDSDYRFDGYQEYRTRLCALLFKSVRQSLLRRVGFLEKPFIGLHLRLGDGFRPPEPGLDGFVRTGWLQQTPIEWFIETLLMIRDIKCSNWPVYVFSDGAPDKLAPVLALNNVYHYASGNPVADLLALSRAALILGSGSSSFSAFATFLGSAHAITAPGHPFSARGLEPINGQLIASFNPRDVNARQWLANNLECLLS